MRIARIGFLFDSTDAERYRRFGVNLFGTYYEEMLEHRGIPFRRVNTLSDVRPERFDILVVGHASDREDTLGAILNFASAGGIVVSGAGLNPLAGRLGFRRQAGLGSGYARFGPEEKRFSFLGKLVVDEEGSGQVKTGPLLRYLHADPWVQTSEAAPGAGAAASGPTVTPASGGTGRVNGGRVRAAGELLQTRESRTEARRQDRALFHEIPYRNGLIIRYAVDVAETIVSLQQGPAPVFGDGVPAPDGTAEVTDGVLKADDVTALDWELDRQPTPSGIPWFAYPYADWWRELWTGVLVRTAWERDLAVPFLDYWPNGKTHVALLSHDSDFNGDDHALTTLKLLDAADIHSTWCILKPGFSDDVLRKAIDAGHEIALHYNAVPEDQGVWGREHFLGQLDWLRRRLPGIEIVSNKNHLTRVEGWGELFEWCEEGGIRAEQSRGPSKKGNLGFIFATCHPYRPVAWANDANRRYGLLEMGFLTPDMNTGKWGDDTLIIPLLSRVAAVEGLAHFLFHQIHLHEREAVRRAFKLFVEEAGRRGFSFMTGAQASAWERLRRSIALEAVSEDGTVTLGAGSSARGHGATVLTPAPAAAAGRALDVEERYGVPCRRQVL